MVGSQLLSSFTWCAAAPLVADDMKQVHHITCRNQVSTTQAQSDKP